MQASLIDESSVEYDKKIAAGDPHPEKRDEALSVPKYDVPTYKRAWDLGCECFLFNYCHLLCS